MKVIKAAAVQISPVLYSREGTVEKVARAFDRFANRSEDAGARIGRTVLRPDNASNLGDRP